MPQAVVHHGAHVVRRDELLAVEPGSHAGAAIEREAAARAGTDLDPFAERVAVPAGEARGEDDVDDIFLRQIRDEDAVDLARASRMACCGTAAGSAAWSFGFCAFSARFSLMISLSVASSG